MLTILRRRLYSRHNDERVFRTLTRRAQPQKPLAPGAFHERGRGVWSSGAAGPFVRR